LSRAVNSLIKVVTGIPIKDATSGFRCYRASALKKTTKTFDKLIQSKGFEVSFEILFKTYWCASRIKEVPNTLDYGRKIGKSKVKLVATIWRYILLLSKLLAWRIEGSIKS
jgi:dolichol-phosphate mannosyltransferase